MSLRALPGEDSIMTKLGTIPGVTVHRGEYSPDSFVPVLDNNKMFQPYLLVKFSGAFSTFDNGICGPEKDTLRNTFSVYVVSPDDRVTGDLRDQVRIAMLTSFSPDDGSALRPTGGFSFVDSDLGYNRYVNNIGFAYYYNLS